MTSLLQAANIYLHYRGGKNVGLAGLIGVIVAIIIALIWPKYIQPIINATGIDKIAENMGIVGEGIGGNAITAYNLFILYLFFCLGFSLIVGIGLLAFVYGSTILSDKFGKVLVGLMIFIPLSPFLVWYVIAKSIEINKEQKRVAENPEEYQEEQRLKKNSDIMDYLTWTTEKNGETNQLRKKDAITLLHRMPSKDEIGFLVGVTYDREAVLLFPRPFGFRVYGTKDNFLGVPLHFEQFIPMKHDPYGVHSDSPQRYYIKPDSNVASWKIEEIEAILYPKKIYDIQLLLKDFNQLDVYKEYVSNVNTHYHMEKEKDNSKTEENVNPNAIY